MDTGRIEHGFYVQGDLKFAVDAADAHKTFDAVQALSNADKIKLAKLNGIVAEPFNKQLLTNILKSVVQNAWFQHKVGNVPTEVLAGHNGRLATYTAAIALPTSAVDFLSKKARAASKTLTSLMYTIDEAKYEASWQSYRSQRYLVVKSMIELKATTGTQGASVRSIHENTKETRETKKPTRNATAQIVNYLIAEGVVTLLNPQDARQKKGTTPKPVVSPAPKPVVKSVTSKKH